MPLALGMLGGLHQVVSYLVLAVVLAGCARRGGVPLAAGLIVLARVVGEPLSANLGGAALPFPAALAVDLLVLLALAALLYRHPRAWLTALVGFCVFQVMVSMVAPGLRNFTYAAVINGAGWLQLAALAVGAIRPGRDWARRPSSAAAEGGSGFDA